MLICEAGCTCARLMGGVGSAWAERVFRLVFNRELFMRTITKEEIGEVSGGVSLTDSVAVGAALGTVAGAAGGYWAGGTLTAATVAGAGVAVIGGALG